VLVAEFGQRKLIKGGVVLTGKTSMPKPLHPGTSTRKRAVDDSEDEYGSLDPSELEEIGRLVDEAARSTQPRGDGANTDREKRPPLKRLRRGPGERRGRKPADTEQRSVGNSRHLEAKQKQAPGPVDAIFPSDDPFPIDASDSSDGDSNVERWPRQAERPARGQPAWWERLDPEIVERHLGPDFDFTQDDPLTTWQGSINRRRDSVRTVLPRILIQVRSDTFISHARFSQIVKGATDEDHPAYVDWLASRRNILLLSPEGRAYLSAQWTQSQHPEYFNGLMRDANLSEFVARGSYSPMAVPDIIAPIDNHTLISGRLMQVQGAPLCELYYEDQIFLQGHHEGTPTGNFSALNSYSRGYRIPTDRQKQQLGLPPNLQLTVGTDYSHHLFQKVAIPRDLLHDLSSYHKLSVEPGVTPNGSLASLPDDYSGNGGRSEAGEGCMSPHPPSASERTEKWLEAELQQYLEELERDLAESVGQFEFDVGDGCLSPQPQSSAKESGQRMGAVRDAQRRFDERSRERTLGRG
jgi:hypothetical protein